MHSKYAIAIGCLLVVCAGSFFWWRYRVAPVKRISALRARAEQGNPKAQFGLASAYYLGRGVPQDYAEALRWYRMAADRGEPMAEDALGYMYLKAQGVPQDYTQALQWYKRAAQHGDRKGQFDLGLVYDAGVGVPADYSEANRWFHKSADQNYAKAQDALGYMYFAGRGVAQDYTQALSWYRKAAEQGYAKAEYDVACMYYKGIGTEQNSSEAQHWYIKAARQGDRDAQQILVSMGTESGMMMKLEFVELVPSVLFGSLALLDFLVRGRKHFNLRNAAVLLLSLSLLTISGMNVYVIAHEGLGYCLYPFAFRIVRRALVGIAVLIIVAVVLPARKMPDAATAR